MSASAAAYELTAPSSAALRLRRIARLRIGLLAFAGALFLLVIGWTIASALRTPHDAAAPPLIVASPRLTGEDSKNRAFVITAAKATREPGSVQRIDLDQPTLDRDEGGADALHVTAAKGIYDQAAGRLYLSGGVRIDGQSGHFATPSTVYDTKTGGLIGAGAVQAQSEVGQLQAQSFSVSGKGRSVIYKGGVHARIERK